MGTKKPVYILVLSGALEDAQTFAETRYADSEKVVISRKWFHETGWASKLHELQKLKGRALLIFFESLLHADQPKLLLCASVFHGCAETVFADGEGNAQVYSRGALIKKLPELILSGALDGLVLVASWAGLRVASLWFSKPVQELPESNASTDIAFLYPFPLQRVVPGGEMSYLKGFLSGLYQRSAQCDIFTGCSLPVEHHPLHVIPNERRFYLLRESQALSYNLHYARIVWEVLKHRRPRILYQRHGRFVLAGAILSRLLRIPLALEYQCSEYWRARNWDPGHFLGLIRLCEDLTISSSSYFVALSAVLRDELLGRGIPAKQIILNPAAVDPERFRPGCGGKEVRNQLGFSDDAVVIGFVGSFSYYHGIPTLQSAIQKLFSRHKESPVASRLRFLLVGDGVLRPEMQEAIQKCEGAAEVVFTGTLRHELIPSYLDACDVLLSPHAPMPDGKPFFGSPSKLFEYMAMGKAIVASNMDQFAEVLTHGKTAWLVQPGSGVELSDAIELLVRNPELRSMLGRNVRRTALEHHTWRQNAARFLSAISPERELVPSGSTPPRI